MTVTDYLLLFLLIEGACFMAVVLFLGLKLFGRLGALVAEAISISHYTCGCLDAVERNSKIG